ncbi:hypothetical protein DN069_22615 [Streptacidiphilus pinicola]|uniref:Uncharacterized protein n=1 Tax=Streptacidiphilus pinicola TaxID=2219663 RepID=A0A2X0K716_9ACTN|nr:DUF2249 domain-containing protein [Streptacidiphilus pinicola]RAG83319.1 hypothetical protein DN069_22615 [Streptacidiphilus pinicola]
MTPSTEIDIQVTGAAPAVKAGEAIEEAGRRLLSTLRAKVALSTELDLAHDALEEAWAALVAFCVGDLRRHLAASDQVLYAPAAGAAETRLLVRALRLQVRSLDERIEALSRTDDADTVDALAHGIEALTAAHLEAEQTVLLPALAALPGGADMESLTAAWSTMQAGGHLDRPDVVDVARIPHDQRHPRIFARYARLAPGEAFTLVNNHDPKPLRREFEAAHPDGFTWDYLESGPERWRVRIGRVATHVR